MSTPSWFIDLDQAHSSYLLLATLTALGLVLGILFQIGLLGWIVRVVCLAVDGGIRKGFALWEHLFAWASWPLFLVIVLALLLVGETVGGLVPALRVLCGLALLLMGATTCLAYMLIDMERCEVERGHKAVHNPLKGQELALRVSKYGEQMRLPILLAASVGMIIGFALLNQGLYETIGPDWYSVEGGHGGPMGVDFLAYALINLLGIVDVLDLAKSHYFLRAAYVHQAQWPASTLLAGFRAFFTLILLQQFFSSLRQGKLLGETITDFWSPHEPIHARARKALPQYGVVAIGPLLMSLRAVPLLTKEQRDQLPLILATIGPSTIPALVRHLHDAQPHVRAIAVATLGHLQALKTVPLLLTLAHDPSDGVRQSLVEALGALLGKAEGRTRQEERQRSASSFIRVPSPFRWLFRWKKRGPSVLLPKPVDLAVAMLASALTDESAAVRTQAARALGRIGPYAATVAPGLIALAKDADETARCQAVEALGQVGGAEEATVAALVELLHDASVSVKAAAARALGALKTAASAAVTALVPLLQDRDDLVRTAAAEAIAQVGPLNGTVIDTLVEGLASADTTVRAQTAEALGTIGVTAEEAAPALIEAMADGNDYVRAKSVEALGKIGEAAASAAVPSLMRALRDQDNWVSALAAEALGQMGESADGAVPALVRSLGHLNPQVRGNAAEALGKMGGAAASTRRALEKACGDEDAAVRSQAIRALGMMGQPTPTSEQAVEAGFQDADPLVRAAAVESVGQWAEPSAAVLDVLASLLEDANDQVKVAAIQVLPKLVGATPAVIDGLCRRLRDADSAWVQVHAALALGKLGPAAVAAGGPLLHAAQTGEVDVREQAMRAIAMIQPPEILSAFASGLQDTNGDIRKVASGGWIKAASIPEEVIPALVMALRDSETQVRANAARALARLNSLPAEAVPLLVACTADPSDGLRLTAATALQLAPLSAVGAVMRQLVEDANLRIRLIAASSLLAADSGDARAGVVVVEALSDPARRVRKAALDLVETLGPDGALFLEALKQRDALEEEEELQEVLTQLIERLGNQRGAEVKLVAN